MKLFVFAALVAATSAGRLEHLERSYLPPDNLVQSGNGFGSGNNQLDVNGHSSNGFARNSAPSRFGSNGVLSFDRNDSHGSNGFGAHPGFRSNGMSRKSFESAPFNQYLPPNHGPSGSSNNAVPQFASRSFPSSLGSASFGSPSRSNSQPQFGASRQYLAPKYSLPQQNSQQQFDEKSGYIY